MPKKTTTKKAAKKKAARTSKNPPRTQWLFVQTAVVAELLSTSRQDVGKLTLWRLERTIKFSDRPVRKAKHESTRQFVDSWGQGWDSFAENPPNAELVVFTGKVPITATLVLSNPQFDPHFENRLTYTVKLVGEGELPVFSGFQAALFIDDTGEPTRSGCKCPKTGYWHASYARKTSPETPFSKGTILPKFEYKPGKWADVTWKFDYA